MYEPSSSVKFPSLVVHKRGKSSAEFALQWAGKVLIAAPT